MKSLSVSEEMKAKIQPFFNSETGRYDIEAVREAQYAATPRRRYSGIFDGTDDDGQITEHTMLSAAVELNEELDHADETFQFVTEQQIVSDIANFNHPTDDRYGDKTIRARFNRLTTEYQRRVINNLLELLHVLENKTDDTSNRVRNRVLYSFTNHFQLGHESDGDNEVQFTHIDLSNAYKFVEQGKVSGQLFEDMTEEYLAKLGL